MEILIYTGKSGGKKDRFTLWTDILSSNQLALSDFLGLLFLTYINFFLLWSTSKWNLSISLTSHHIDHDASSHQGTSNLTRTNSSLQSALLDQSVMTSSKTLKTRHFLLHLLFREATKIHSPTVIGRLLPGFDNVSRDECSGYRQMRFWLEKVLSKRHVFSVKDAL